MMLQSIYRCPRWFEHARDCWLGKPIDSFLAHLKALRYSKVSLRNNAYILLRFAAFIRNEGSCRIADLPKCMGEYVARYTNCHTRTTTSRSISHFIAYLRTQGALTAISSQRAPQPFGSVVEEYARFLTQCRGLHEETVSRCTRYCLKFLRRVRGAGTTRLFAMKPPVLQAFLLSEGQQYGRKTMSSKCFMLRQFLSYLHSTGRISVDLSAAVIAPRIYRHEGCPRPLSQRGIEAVLKNIDRRAREGKRTYAMLLLLATYGLRGIEAVKLELGDIDWRAAQIHVRQRKAGNSSVYPLTTGVGNAIVAYLKNRPNTDCRRVFVTLRAPYGPMRTGTLIHYVKKYLRLTGLPTDGLGTHLFRYSCAQRLLEAETSLKLIGDYLGHRDLTTTQRYLKIDVEHLREVALNLPENAA